MTGKIFRAILTVALIVLVISLLTVTGFLYDYFGTIQEKELRDQLNFAAVGTESLGISFLEKLRGENYRLTLIQEDGRVLFDTDADPQTMENHRDREEIQQAFWGGTGRSSRYSSTLTEKTTYEAVRLTDGTVLRISVSHYTSWLLLLGMIQPVLIIGLLAAVLSGLLASSMAKKVVAPLNTLDLEHPLENDTYPELSPLLHRIHVQHQEIEIQIKNLQQKNNEFQLVTDNMGEGLVLLNENGIVLTINTAAKKIFQTDDNCIGEDFLTVDRKQDLHNSISQALETGHCSLKSCRNNREYNFDINRIESEGKVLGAVMLIFDITLQTEGERRRREFTANVSHELKTPLQSIIGSTELLENNMVQQHDIPRFLGHIKKQATRLLHLIQDILRLSQLDEGIELNRETVDLRSLTEEIIDSLEVSAQEKNIHLNLEGNAHMQGMKSLLYEILYNLVDNGIKYNIPGGNVTVLLQETEKNIVVSVSDTGIGIPEEDHSRVFERFYRVDKSHSKSSGGTGLGLSIVKHGVELHKGQITVESEEKMGTTMTIVFPKSE